MGGLFELITQAMGEGEAVGLSNRSRKTLTRPLPSTAASCHTYL